MMSSGGLAREAVDFAVASAVVAVVGLSLFLDVSKAFGLSALDAIAVCMTAFLAHDLAHKLCARLLAGGGRFKLAVTGSLISLLAAGLQHLMGVATVALGFSTGEPIRLAPYRFLVPGTVVVRGRKKRETLGRIAMAGPAANVVLGWLMFFLGLSSPQLSEILLIGAAMSAYVAVTSLLPIAFCDGLTIYWWSRWAFVGTLAPSVALIAASNFVLLTSSWA